VALKKKKSISATSFKFDQKTIVKLDSLVSRTGATSKTEVLRKAITIMDILVRTQEECGEIVLKGKKESPDKVLLLW
jgi:hypothetical protein